jgi:hypothetical protein
LEPLRCEIPIAIGDPDAALIAVAQASDHEVFIGSRWQRLDSAATGPRMSARRNTFYRASKFTRGWVQVVRIERVPPAIRGASRQVRPGDGRGTRSGAAARPLQISADLGQVGKHVG